MKKNKKANFSTAVALAIIVATTSSTVYGMNLPDITSMNVSTINSQYYKSGINIKRKLDGLVTLGSINQSQESAVINYLVTYKQPIQDTNKDILSIFGPVSKTQETTILNLFEDYKSSISKAVKDDFSSKLDGLIALGTITKQQKDIIMNLYTISENSAGELVGLDTLVTNKTITKDKKSIILNTFMECKQSTSKAINDILLAKLDKSVLNGTINKDQRAAVINLARIPSVDSAKIGLQKILDPLVDAGTITKDNETEILNVLL